MLTRTDIPYYCYFPMVLGLIYLVQGLLGKDLFSHYGGWRSILGKKVFKFIYILIGMILILGGIYMYFSINISN